MKKTSDIIPLNLDENNKTSLRTPSGFAATIDDFLIFIEKKRGLRISRNKFILKAIRFYLDHLMLSKDVDDVVRKIHMTEAE